MAQTLRSLRCQRMLRASASGPRRADVGSRPQTAQARVRAAQQRHGPYAAGVVVYCLPSAARFGSFRSTPAETAKSYGQILRHGRTHSFRRGAVVCLCLPSGLHRISLSGSNVETGNRCRTAGESGRRAVTRILIADDHEVVRSGLRKILEAQPGWEVVAEAADGKEAVAKAIETVPDIAIVDYSLPILNGLEVTRQIRQRQPRTEVLIFTMHEDDALITELLQAGVRGYLLKSDASRYLIAAVDSLASRKPFFTSSVSEALLRSFIARTGREVSALTPRERQIVQLIAEGHTNKAIAQLLNISLKTVETHRAAVMRKLNLASSAALVRYAIRNRLVEP